MPALDNNGCVVFGATFGKLYVDALASGEAGYRLTALGGKGGRHSAGLADSMGVPVLGPHQPLPPETSLVCVVVRSGLLGGRGSEVVARYLQEGIDVVQEHPVHQREMAEHVRSARLHGARYYLNTLYDQLPAVAAFIERATRLQATNRVRHLEVWSSYQVAFAAVDLASLVCSLRDLDLQGESSSASDIVADADAPRFKRLWGRLGPRTTFGLRVDMSLDPGNPDEHPHLLIRAELICSTGTLLLADVHGPVLWLPRPYVPNTLPLGGGWGSDLQRGVGADTSSGFQDDRPHPVSDDLALSQACVHPGCQGGFADAVKHLWPAAIARLLKQVHAERGTRSWLGRAQRHLEVCDAWTTVSRALGLPALRHHGIQDQAGEAINDR